MNIEELFLKNANSYTDSLNSVPAMTLEDFIEAIKSIHSEFLQKIDWILLRQQKTSLIRIIEDRKANPKLGHFLTGDLQGILHLIDAIQDYAVDVMGLTDKEVFNLSEDAEDHS